MAKICVDEKNVSDGQVLYELLVYKDWKLDPEQWKPVTQHTLRGDDNPDSWWWNLLRICGIYNKIPWPEEDLAKAAVFLLPWQISLSHNGKRVAVLQDTVLEIRASRDEYTTIIGRATIPRDKRPQFRKICWSPDSQMIAVASSDGSVRVYDFCGSLIFKIPLIAPESNTKKFITGLEFIRSREKKNEWELLIIYGNGSLDCYIISAIDKCLFSHHSVLSENGISCSAFSQEHGILFVSMKAVNVLSFESSALTVGLTAWKLLNEAPYYKKIFPTVDDLHILKSHRKIWMFFTLFATQDCINKIVLSPSNEYLATLHTNGNVLIWLSPILRIYCKLDKLDTKQQKVMVMLSETSTSCHAIDIEWRRDNKLIVGWKSGTISIHDINSSVVLTYFGPEILNGLPRLTSAPSLHGFLVLECETVHFVRPSVSPDISSDEEKSILDTTSELIQSTMYLLTDLEKYEPKMKSVKIVQRIFRLLGVKMTTPEELFERYLQNNEFDKAFEICDEYGLDIMKVYQRQWRTSEVCDYTIQEYLSNVQDEEWILTECLDRIPETLIGAKLLIEYSLNFTDRKLSYLDELKKTNEVLFKKFILARLKFLDYAAKFQVFEQIIDEDSYSMTHYERFRRQSIVDSAIDFARSGHSAAIELLFTHHGREILPYWLNILDNFPEAVNPMDYRSLLPECDGDGVPVNWKFINVSETSDWSKEKKFSEFHETIAMPQQRFDIYCFDSKGLSDWYKKRALTLEKLSTVVDNAVNLLELGIERNIKDLEEMLYKFKMLCTLVYDLNLDVNFDYFQKQCTLQKLQLFIPKSDDFDANMIRYVHPALEYYADKHSDMWYQLYNGFLLNNSKKILGPVLKYISYILHGNLNLIGSPERLVNILIDCIYAYESSDLLDESENLVNDTGEWLSALSENIILKRNKLFKSLLIMKNEIRSANILLKHHYGKSLSYLHEIKKNFEKSKQFMEDFTKTIIKSLPPDIDVWVSFLTDLLDLQENCFLCISTEYCYEIFVSHMLKSSSLALIENSPGILCCSKSEPQRHLSFETSVRIVISSSQYYFNSSSHFDDKFMQMAKTCLLLIKEDNEEIQEELDLIFSMKLLSELDVNILPIQVRQTKERIKLIDICFDRNSHAYKNPQLIYKLAFKLHLLPNRLRCYNIITIRLAQEALKRRDYNACFEFCNELVIKRFSESWKLCMNLGECNEYHDIQAKLRLITFSSIFAPARVLPHLFKIREELKFEQMVVNLCNSLDNCVQYKIFQNIDSSMWNKLKVLASTNNKQEILQTIIELWSNLMIDDSKFQKTPSDFLCVIPHIYSLIHPPLYRISSYYCVTSDVKMSMESEIFTMFDSFLKLILMNSDLENYKIKEILIKALTSCGISASKEDSALSLCYFLCLTGLSANIVMKNCFKETQLLYEFELYFIALKDLCLYSKQIFSSTPTEVISSFINNPFKEPNLKYFKDILVSLKNYNQVKQVKSLECGIDTTRYNQDEYYKKDTIFGLAMNEEYENLKVAIDLARHNNLPVCEIVVSHLISLLINSSSAALQARICNEEIITILSECKDLCIERLMAILPTIGGTNYQVFISYFTLVKMLREDHCIWLLTPKEHISLLKKLKSLSKDIDYRDLLLCNDELHFILQPLMNSENVLVVNKFIKSLPMVIKNKYQIGKFFCHWAIEEFNKKCINVSFKKSVLNFENLSKFFSKLSDDELQIFVENTVFSISTMSIMDSGIRKQFIISLLDWCSSNNTRNQYEGSLSILKKNMDILNQLWNEDYEHWNQLLKGYVLLLEQHLREPDHEENILDVLKSAVLNPTTLKTDIIYLHKVTQIKDPILCMITKLLNSANPEILDKWQNCFSEVREKVSRKNEYSYCKDILEKDSDSPCELGANWLDAIFNTFKEDFPHEILLKNISNIQSCTLFLPELVQKTSNFDQITVLHKYLQELSDSVKCDKQYFMIKLVKLLANTDTHHKYELARDILLSSYIQPKDLINIINDNTLLDQLFLSWLCFQSDSSEVQEIGRNLVEKEGEEIYNKIMQLPPFVIGELCPFLIGTNFHETLIIKCLRHDLNDDVLKSCVKALMDKCMVVEANTLLLYSTQTPNGLKSFDTVLCYSSYS